MWVVATLLCLLALFHAIGSEESLRIVESPENGTVLVNRKFTFHCRAEGPPHARIRITWQHNKVTLRPNGNHYRIKGGKLKFTRVLLSHTGHYWCVAESETAIVRSSYAYLHVQAPAEITEGPTNRSVHFGTRIQLKCMTVGVPRPNVSWKKNGVQIIDPLTDSVYSRHLLYVNVTETAVFQCIAENIHYEGRTERKQTAVVKVIEEPRVEGVCAPYNGSVCQDFLGSRPVFVNTSFGRSMELQESIVMNLTEELIVDLKAFCGVPAMQLLCHYAFPDCDRRSSAHLRPKPLCRENCFAVKDLFCFDEWITIEKNKEEGVFLRSRAHFRLPNCSRLPSVQNNSCSEADLFQIEPKHVTEECYHGDGRYYVGKVNVTRLGIPCQPWAAQSPQRHDRWPANFPILQGAENYCRNAGGEEDAPWCYTTSTRLRWQTCDIPKCDEDEEVKGLIDELHKEFALETIIIISAVSTISLVLMVLIAILCHRTCRHRQVRYDATPQDDLDIDLDRLQNNECYHKGRRTSVLNPKLEKLEYPRNDVIYLKDIGQGAFGRVFQARCPGIIKGQEQCLVAVKMLKDDATEEMQKDFEREASLMVEFNHLNIVKLLGVCAVGRPMCLLFEFMCSGDLNDFLRNCSPEHFIVRRRSNEMLSEEMPKLDHVEQLEIAKQISSGMVYISNKGYVHRDLATRNCLVGDGLTVKIADFGLCRSVHGDFYKGSEHDAIPIRWMPIEAILYNKFTSDSDVWSFGVVLWEIFSFALQPYYGMTHEEVVKYIKEGKYLSCPDNTPQDIYELMKLCWFKKATNRPSFGTLYKSICLLQDDLVKLRKKQDKERNHNV